MENHQETVENRGNRSKTIGFQPRTAFVAVISLGLRFLTLTHRQLPGARQRLTLLPIITNPS